MFLVEAMRRRSVSDSEEANLKLLMKIEQVELESKYDTAEKKRMQNKHMLERSRDRMDVTFLLIFCIVSIVLTVCMNAK
jgi:hypothetical protein